MKRRTFIRSTLLGVAGVPLLAAEGLAEPNRFEVTRTRLVNNRLNRTLRIVQVTDMHLTYRGNDESIPGLVNELKPDLVLFTGDYVDHGTGTPPDMRRFRSFIHQFDSTTPMFAIFGNWDRGYEGRLFKRTLVRSVRNRRESVMIDGNTVSITGMDYYHPDMQLLETQVADADLRCLLYHSPDMVVFAAPTGNYDLMLAGHTHGGQVRFPFLRLLQDGHGSFPWPGAIITGSYTGTRYQSGHYRLQDMDLYVSRGLGETDGIPFRFLCRPELAVIEIGPEGA